MILHKFSNIIFTKGATRTFAVDIQHNKFWFVPNSMCEFLENYNHKTKDEIFADFEKSDHEIVKEYLDFLQKNLIAAFLPKENVKNFTEFNLTYHSPYLFENVIVDIDKNFNLEILQKLDKIKIPYIQIRFLDKINFEILQILENLSFISVEIIINFENFNENDFEKYPKISKIFVYNSSKNNIKELHNKQFIYKKLANFECCGLVTKQTFSLTTSHICLSQKHNSCLYKKLYISTIGEIKNCPQAKSFGNILDFSTQEILDLLQNKEITKCWNITKKEILVCQDCEFRNVCTDCRYFLQDKNNQYSKPANCSYNPYSAEWKKPSKK
ncbi:MAG: grasp-with-spasm system SPASM domain peptide maturase [Prevotellaceae bacterium]|jgi:SPASM domain peptide maturase of grasp-with-spasm system|nr:grasp-with-spasm system SPASM domain peptide maturase [Prevotellaceae bacterium]